jgi:hypothetical protein
MILSLEHIANGCFSPELLYWIAVSNIVRFGSRGIHIYTDAPKQFVSSEKTFHCVGTEATFCAVEPYNFFTCERYDPSVYNHRLWRAAPPLEKLWRKTADNEVQCEWNRRQTFYSNISHNIQSCDLNRVTLIWSHNTIQILYDTDIDVYSYIVLVCLMVLLTISLSESITYMFGDEHSSVYPIYTSVMILVSIVVIGINTHQEYFLTSIERWCYGYFMLYVLLYTIYHMHRTVTINVVIATLTLIIARLEYTFESIYTVPVVFLICTRMFQKSLFIVYSDTMPRDVMGFVFLDLIAIGFLYSAGMIDAYRDSREPIMYLIAVVFVAWVAARLLYLFRPRDGAKAGPSVV